LTQGSTLRTRGNEGKRLGRLRAELAERSFALFKRSGNLARMTLRGLENVAKRYLIHAAAYNLGLIMRAIFGQGTPKGMADALKRLVFESLSLFTAIWTLLARRNGTIHSGNIGWPSSAVGVVCD